MQIEETYCDSDKEEIGERALNLITHVDVQGDRKTMPVP